MQRGPMVAFSEPGGWPAGPGQPRVLFEDWNAPDLADHVEACRRAGYLTAACGGPRRRNDGLGGRTELLCPLVEGEACSLAEGADIIVVNSILRPESEKVLRALRERFPGTPILVEIRTDAERLAVEQLEGCETLEFPVTPEALLARIGAALARA